MPDEKGGVPLEVEAPTIKAAVATATELIEAGETKVEVTSTEPEQDEKTWKKLIQESLKQLQNEQTEVRAILTRVEDRFKLVISSKETPNPEQNSENSQISELPLKPPANEQTSVGDGHPEPETPQPLPRKRRKI